MNLKWLIVVMAVALTVVIAYASSVVEKYIHSNELSNSQEVECYIDKELKGKSLEELKRLLKAKDSRVYCLDYKLDEHGVATYKGRYLD